MQTAGEFCQKHGYHRFLWNQAKSSWLPPWFQNGGQSRWKRDRGVKCHHCNLLTCDSNPASAESATTLWSFDVWPLRLNFFLYSDRVPLPPPKLTTCKFQQLKEMALGINCQGQLMWPRELAGLLWLSSSCPAQSPCPLYQTSAKTVAISRDRGKRHWRPGKEGALSA